MDLNGRWEFRRVGDSTWYEATVPGTVHTDLYKNVLIEDPFYRSNEKKQQWIDQEDWEYIKVFTPDKSLFSNNHLKLVFDGIDTFGEVFLNGQKIISADNMFRRWTVDISSLIRKGEPNELRVIFHSPIHSLQKIYLQQAYHLPAVNDQAEEKLSVYGRKAPYHFGWDWGPRFVTSGLWKSVSLESWNQLKLADVYYQQIDVDSAHALIEVKTTVISDAKTNARLTVLNKNGNQTLLSESIVLQKGRNTFSHQINIANPALWWPNGLGDPNLYLFEAEVNTKKESSTLVKKVGLRKVELVREADSLGESFFFRVNGIPVFAKGANYIPQDIFLNHVMSTEYDHLIKSAKDANMNMLRVWGGGIYELDYFYDLCDANGIMLWQDFMFACSMYPGDSSFLNNFRQEAMDNISRLRNHASIVLWCGNNEIQDAWFGWGWQNRYSEEQKKEITDNYTKLFHELIPSILKDLDPLRPYWPSSPVSGTNYGQISNTTSGDFHYWGVWHSRLPFESYAEVIPRFSSEYGFQSFPSLKTIESYTLPADRFIDSEVMRDHQRHPIGNQLILDYMERYYPVPEDFAGFVYMSQVMQGEGIRFGIEALRRSMPRCMGSLYWQLNDCWPVASWSGMDYFGRWKSLHYQAKEAYAPCLLSFSESDDSLSIFLISDKPENHKGLLKVLLEDFDGKVLFETDNQVSIQGLSSQKVLTLDKKAITGLAGNQTSVFMKASFTSEEIGTLTNLHYFKRSNQLDLPKVRINFTIDKQADRDYLIISSDKLARQVFVDYRGEAEVRFEPNFFDLMPGEVKCLKIFKLSRKILDPDKITVQSINAYNSPSGSNNVNPLNVEAIKGL